MKKRHLGFSLLEILGVLVILGILAGLALNMSGSKNLDLGRASSDLSILLQKSRFEAIKRNRLIEIKPDATLKSFTICVVDPSTSACNNSDIALWEVKNYPGLAVSSSSIASGTPVRWSTDGTLTNSSGSLVAANIQLAANSRTVKITINTGGQITRASL